MTGTVYLTTCALVILSPRLCLAQRAPLAAHSSGPRATVHTDRAHIRRPGSQEEAAILNALLRARPYLRRPVQAALVVDTLKVHRGWAYLSATPTAPGNSPDSPHYAHEEVLLHRIQGRWKVVHTFDFMDDRSVQKARTRYPAAPRDLFPR